ncbi:MAG: flagellar protein FliT [Candidatus Krumholzibacteria bacterium]|nr:flagellar protein FliT [Candidatus Krumholzibacteria bacterium]MDP6669028.1 flagellar protein FliT [Candidatus Krumholzibacteria bacterium]MDP6796306.1 flagellar protein FliT [Candidatus Krumholzibacteria bacterium]MDP7020967.1 flagellar protein FliT [Candidatus Krumholzibacteria bacterium]
MSQELFERLHEVSRAQVEASMSRDLDSLESLNVRRRELMHQIESRMGSNAWGDARGRIREILFEIMENDRKLKLALLERMRMAGEGISDLRLQGQAERSYLESKDGS